MRNEKKVTWRETLRETLRAVSVIQKNVPQYLPVMLLKEILGAISPYVTVYLSARILDALVSGQSGRQLWLLVCITVAAVAGLTALNGVLKEKWNTQQSRFLLRENLCYDEKYMELDYADADDAHTRDLLQQIEQNRNWRCYGVIQVLLYLPDLVSGAAGAVGAVALTVSLFLLPVPESAGGLTLLNSPWMGALFGALLVGAAMIGPLCDGKSTMMISRLSQNATLGNRLFSAFGFTCTQEERAEDVRMYNQQKISRYYMNKDDAFSTTGVFARTSRGVGGLLEAASGCSGGLVMTIVYLFVCLKAWAGAFGIGAVTQYVGAVTAFAGNLRTILKTLSTLHANTPFLQLTFEYLDMPNRMYQGSLTTEKRSDRNYAVEFRDVSFRYPGSTAWALRHVNVKFQIGERMAVVGENGSGKTTFIKLLCRLYDPQEGQILLNGIDIRKYRYEEYINVFSVVFQDFKLLNQSLGSNVAGSLEYDRPRAKKALTDAGFTDRLAAFPQGLDTCLGKEYEKDGVEVSGGEAQKIAIARALYKDAPFLILDEPTAALDPIAEAEIYARFSSIVTDKTAVYISHRLSSCKFCDEILVFDRGSVIQQGTHEALLAEEGKYRTLWSAQAKWYVQQAQNATK